MLLRARPQTTGIAVDYDGTLAEIAADPATARPLEGAAETLVDLAATYAVVAVVSGRPISFLLDRLAFDQSAGVELYGQHGLERWDRSAGGAVLDPAAVAYLPAVARVLSSARRQLPDGVRIEDKGGVAVGLHWRAAPQYAAAVGELASTLADKEGLVVRHGKMAVELVPPVERDKGSAVAELMVGCSAGCVLGDDDVDLPGFVALDALERAGGFVGVRVAVGGDEIPAALVEAADLIVDGPSGALAFLAALSRSQPPS